MKNDFPRLTDKTLTRLLDKNFRARLLSYYKTDIYKIDNYAKYVVDSQIVQRDLAHKDDKTANYGLQPLTVLCAVLNDGTVKKRLFECKTINHFLVKYDGFSAIEVVKCILLMWLNEEKSIIRDFDYEVIDKALVELDKQYKPQEKQEEKAEQQ